MVEAHGPGRYIKDADQGKGLLVTGGYDFAKLEAVDAQHNRPLRNPSRGKPSGAGPDIEAEMKFGQQFFTGRYTASFNHSWGHDAELSTRQGQHQGHALERQHVPGNYFFAREVLQSSSCRLAHEYFQHIGRADYLSPILRNCLHFPGLKDIDKPLVWIFQRFWLSKIVKCRCILPSRNGVGCTCDTAKGRGRAAGKSRPLDHRSRR